MKYVVLNDRPLTYLCADVTDPGSLTPSQLLDGWCITTLLNLEVEDDEMTDPTYCVSSALREKPRSQIQLLQHFQSRWKKEYLTSLLEVHKATETKFNIETIKVGDVVFMHDNTPRMQWRLTVIEKLIKGLDGFVRVARIQTNSGKTNRPIAKINYTFSRSMSWRIMRDPPMNEEKLSLMMIDVGDDDATSVPQRSMRKDAVRVHNVIKNWTSVFICGPGGCQE